MSLEKAIQDLTAAVEANTEVQKEIAANQGIALKASGVRGKKEEAEDDEPPRRGRRAAAEKEEVEEEAPRSRRRAAAEKEEVEEEAPRSRRRAAAEDDEPAPKPKRGAKDKGPKKTDMPAVQKAFADFLDVSHIKVAKKAKAEEKDRRDFINDMFDHLEIEKLGDMADEDFDQAIDWVKRFADGEDVEFAAD